MNKPWIVVLLGLLLAPTAAVSGPAEPNPAEPSPARRAQTIRLLRERLEFYLRAANATPEELEELRMEELRMDYPDDGITMMQLNPFMRARVQLVGVLSPQEREALLRGEKYVSPPFGKLPKRTQEMFELAIGTGRLTPPERKQLRYQLSRQRENGVEYLSINRIEPATGKPGSGGSVIGVWVRDP